MNRHSLTRTIFGVAILLLLAACSQDELAGDGTQLPEGKYPLQIASVSLSAEVTDEPWGASEAPQTRVAESADGGSSHWTNGDEIGIKIGEDGTPGRYRVDVDGTGSVTGVTAIDAAYWTSTAQAAVAAWYPTAETVSLADQSDKLAYVLKGSGTGTYNAAVTLDFTHSLAKVRVIPSGSDAGKVTGIMIKTYTSCTHTNGTNIKGSKEDWITMMKVSPRSTETVWEANVVPDATITQLLVNGNIPIQLKDGGIVPVAAKINTITLMVGKTEIYGGETITEPGEYIMKGNYEEGVTLNGDNINLIIEEASSTAATAIHVKGGTPTITVKGMNNSFNCGDTPILLAPGANVIIKGSTSNPEDSKLTIRTSTDNAAGIGSATNSSCGNISITYITLDVYGGTGEYGGAAIGTNGSFGSSSGNITIENSVVYAKGGTGAAAIGLACGSNSLSCGEIVIRYSKIYATTTYDGFYGGYAACIGHGAFAYNNYQPVTVGKITITTDESKEVFFGTDRFKAIDDSGKEVTTGFYKVGKCNISIYQPLQTWSGVYFGKEGEETELASGSSNGY